ncbi:glycosyltransferase family 4 protein [Limisphaera sp. VF-2]|jgi:glycosyltransferase involved in cell wall biosynthesis|uniref:glycosyltransferase family 4 protein n=1 Tax=Limisphaera sp. VF-2 TaxID=3400418 RepID=UPI0030B43307
MTTPPIKVAWITYFPVEWLPEAPEELRNLPRHHPASWQRVLLRSWLENNPGLELHIVALRKQFPRSLQFRVGPARFYCVRTTGGLRAPTLFWYDTWKVRQVLRAIRPDLVHAWGTENGAALVAARLGWPFLVTVQGLMSWYCRVVPEATPYNRLAAWLERCSLPRAPLVTTESRFAVDFIRGRFRPRAVMQIEHAPDPLFHRVQRAPAPDRIRLVANARFHYAKGTDLLLRAVHRLQPELPLELVHIGPPLNPLADQLRSELGAGFWDRIQFRRDLTPQEVAAELARATLLVCPTRVDVSPNSVKEAVAAGVPVVASRVGGIPDYVVPDRNGLLLEPGNLDELVRALRQACHHPLFRHGKVEAGTLAQMREYLSPETMARRFFEAYQHVLQTVPRHAP